MLEEALSWMVVGKRGLRAAFPQIVIDDPSLGNSHVGSIAPALIRRPRKPNKLHLEIADSELRPRETNTLGFHTADECNKLLACTVEGHRHRGGSAGDRLVSLNKCSQLDAVHVLHNLCAPLPRDERKRLCNRQRQIRMIRG